MTLETLLEELTALHYAARTAPVIIRRDDFDHEVLSVRYERGEVRIEVEDEGDHEPDD